MGWSVTATGKGQSVTIDGAGVGSFTAGADAESSGLTLIGFKQHTFSGDTQNHEGLEFIAAGGVTELDPWIGLTGDSLKMGDVKATGNLAQAVDFIRLTGDRGQFPDWKAVTDRHGLVLDGADRNQISDWHLTVGSQANNTWDGINVTDSDANEITGILVVGTGGGNNPRYGVNITDAASDDNYLCGIHAPDAVSGHINDTGTGTRRCLMSDDVAWQTWSPSYANLTVGDGTVVARYSQIGKTVVADFTFTLGTTSTIGSNPTVSSPVAASAQYTYPRNNIGNGYVLDSGTATFDGAVRLQDANTLSVGLRRIATGGAVYIIYANITATVPMTWATGDLLYFRAIYEAA